MARKADNLLQLQFRLKKWHSAPLVQRFAADPGDTVKDPIPKTGGSGRFLLKAQNWCVTMLATEFVNLL